VGMKDHGLHDSPLVPGPGPLLGKGGRVAPVGYQH